MTFIYCLVSGGPQRLDPQNGARTIVKFYHLSMKNVQRAVIQISRAQKCKGKAATYNYSLDTFSLSKKGSVKR